MYSMYVYIYECMHAQLYTLLYSLQCFSVSAWINSFLDSSQDSSPSQRRLVFLLYVDIAQGSLNFSSLTLSIYINFNVVSFNVVTPPSVPHHLVPPSCCCSFRWPSARNLAPGVAHSFWQKLCSVRAVFQVNGVNSN